MASTLTNLVHHIVFSTKMRMNLIQPEIEEELYPYIGGIINGEKGTLLNIGGIENHIHILAKFHPAITVSTMLQKIKGNSSTWLQHKKGIPFEWQRGYGAFSVSESIIPKVAKYIINQKEHHKQLSFEEELIKILQKNKISYNEKYLWD